MAFLQGRAKQEGEWVTVGHDDKRKAPIRLRIRRAGVQLVQKFLRKHKVGDAAETGVNNIRRARATRDTAAECLLESENLSVSMDTQDDVDFYAEATKAEGLKVGQDVYIDGCLDAVKLRALEDNPLFVGSVMDIANAMEKGAVEAEGKGEGS